MNVQEFFDKYPVLKQVLDFLEQNGGLILVIVFTILMIYIFYWIIVIAPRRVRQVFTELSTMGYSDADTDSKEVEQTVDLLAPIYPISPRKDQEIPEWKMHLALRRYAAGNTTRYIVNVSRSQIDKVGRMNSTLRKTNLILEKRDLNFSEPVYIYPFKNPGSVQWEERHKLQKITSGLDKELLKKYHVYSKSAVIKYFPKTLIDALMTVCDTLCDTSLYCFQGGVILKFQKEGWGICPANEIYKITDMKVLIKIADDISNALS
jgi:hypothetical protein